MKKKRPLSLLEVLIALSLTTVIMGALFSFYRQTSALNIKFEKNKQLVLERSVFQQRMTKLFDNVHWNKEDKESLPFIIHRQNLEVVFDNGIEPEPAWGGILSGKLYIDDRKQLALELRSPNGDFRKDVFFHKVRELQILAFDAQNKCWTSHWDKQNKTLPSMVKLSVIFETQKKHPVDFAFFIPSYPDAIVYREDAVK